TQEPCRVFAEYLLAVLISPFHHAAAPAAVSDRSPGAPFAPENPRGTVPIFISSVDSRSECGDDLAHVSSTIRFGARSACRCMSPVHDYACRCGGGEEKVQRSVPGR